MSAASERVAEMIVDGPVACPPSAATSSASPLPARAPRDAARADVSVEERQRRAVTMLKRYARHETLRELIVGGLMARRECCLDDDEELAKVADEVIRQIEHSADALFLRELLGDDPADRMTRMHAHGALFDRGVQAAWRLAGGE